MAIQPLVLLTTALHTLPYLWSSTRPFKVEYITVNKGSTLRVLVYMPPPRRNNTTKTTHLRPLHLDIHDGAFIGGNPEEGAAFCKRVARDTGAVVVSPT